jgi:tetratricopeptide (TPR) repeat protein
MRKTITISINFIYATIIVVITSNGLAAKEINHISQYRDCMKLSKKAPQKAFDAALNWHGLGGGYAAEHCLAVALIGLGQYKEAAERLERLALNVKQTANIKVGLLAHAAQAWILAGRSVRAEALLTAALKLSPGDATLLIDRAQSRAGQKDYTGAIEDLNRAIKLEERLADAFVFRASAYRHLNKLEPALADVEHALILQPEHPDGLLERGNLRRLRENEIGARKDWLTLIRKNPKSTAAEAARLNLERLDLKIRR